MSSSSMSSRARRPTPLEIVPLQTGEDTTMNASTATSPERSNSQSSSSDYSPLTSTFSTPATARQSSTNSSIASSPLAFDQLDLNNSTGFTKRSAPALPDVQEHPLELEDQHVSGRGSFERIRSGNPFVDDQSQLVDEFASQEAWPEMSRTTTAHSYSCQEQTWNAPVSDTEMRCEPSSKRRRSGQTSVDSITSRFFDRLPSLTKHKGRKRHLVTRSEGNSGVSSPVAQRSRSTSRARPSVSLFRQPDAMEVGMGDVTERLASERIQTINEDDDHDDESGELQPFHSVDNNECDGKPEELERVHTPLLPMLVDDCPTKEPDVQSLEPPRVVDSVMGDFAYDSAGSIQHTPQLSAKPSTNFGASSFSTAFSEDNESFNSSGSLLAAPDDEWSDKLGHANFFIRPNPYLPSNFTAGSCSALLVDWDKARSEYSKHLARTSRHFGIGSKTYRLTEEKWATIDATWKRNYDAVRARASVNGDVPPNSPTEPAPVVKIPSLDDKFPQLADYEIVGAMERVAPPERANTQIRRESSVRNGFKKFMDGLNKRNRSISGPQ